MAATTSTRSYTSTSFLSHDMSPCDPYSRSKTTMETGTTSQATPRDFRLRGYTSHQMLEEHSKPQPQTEVSPTRRVATNPVTKVADPGKSEQSCDFFQGKYTTEPVRTKSNGTIENRFSGAEAVKSERSQLVKQQSELRQYIDIAAKSKMEKSEKQMAEKSQDRALVRSYDPWTRPGATSPTNGGKGLMSVERAEQQAASRTTDTYVAQMFGKQGAGAPVRGESGEVVATYHIDGDTQMGNLFRNNFGVHATVRYGEKGTVNEYKAALDQQSVERAQKVERERTEQQTSEPGFFLKPSEKQPSRVRVAKDVSPGELERRVNYAKTLEEQSKDQKTRKQQQQAAAKATGDDYKPWGKGIGTVDRDTEGKLVKKVPVPWVQAEPTIVNFLGKPGAGAPVVEGSGRLSPQKQSVSPDPFDPFGKPGAGAPGLDGARRQRGADDQGPSLSPTARQGLLREQQAMIEAHRQQERDAAVANGGGSSPDQFFKFGQGAANPKRDDNGMLQRQNRGQTDIIGMNLDTGGGLGRKQKTENSRALHDALDRQAQDKMTTESSTRQMTIAEEQKHVSAAGTWQGKPGAGAPRRNEQGEVHGRYGLDKEMHYEELVDTPKNTALPERKKYGDDLNKMINDKSTLSQQQVALGREKSNVHASSVNSKFGKQGNGAPLRDAQGKLVAQPSRLREKTDVEWKVNVKPGYTME